MLLMYFIQMNLEKHIIEIENIATEFYFNINILRYTWIGVVIRSINLKYYKN